MGRRCAARMTKAQEVALWAALAGFFGSLLAIGIFDILNPDKWAEYLGALIVAFITGGAVYAKERLGFAKQRPDNGPPPKVAKPGPTGPPG
jgi:hypothetical protein